MVSAHALLKPSVAFFAAGNISIIAATYALESGKVSSRFRWVKRGDNPSLFWTLVVFYYLIGLAFIVIALKKEYGNTP